MRGSVVVPFRFFFRPYVDQKGETVVASCDVPPRPCVGFSQQIFLLGPMPSFVRVLPRAKWSVLHGPSAAYLSRMRMCVARMLQWLST